MKKVLRCVLGVLAVEHDGHPREAASGHGGGGEDRREGAGDDARTRNPQTLTVIQPTAVTMATPTGGAAIHPLENVMRMLIAPPGCRLAGMRPSVASALRLGRVTRIVPRRQIMAAVSVGF
jgi:hypothetical protein